MYSSGVIPPHLLLADSVLYASQGGISALDVSNGMIHQKYSLSGGVCPSMANNVLYLNVSHDPNYQVQALQKDGSSLWSYPVQGRLAGPPVIIDGVVYATTVEGSIYALQARDGALLWHTTLDLGPDVPSYLGPIVYHAPAIFDETVYLTPTVNAPLQPFLYTFGATDGMLLWKAPIPDASTFPLTVMDTILYLSTFHGCTALRRSDGFVLWQQELGGTTQVCSHPVILNGRIYLSASELKSERSSSEPGGRRHWQQALLCALRASDGMLLWQQEIGDTTHASRPTEVFLLDAVLYVGVDGTFSAYHSEGGTALWHYQTSGTFLSSPTGANGVVYVGDTTGYVSALRAKDGTLLWQTFTSTTVTSAGGILLRPFSEDV